MSASPDLPFLTVILEQRAKDVRNVGDDIPQTSNVPFVAIPETSLHVRDRKELPGSDC